MLLCSPLVLLRWPDMSQVNVVNSRPIQRLTVSATAPQRILFACANDTLEASVLARDLIRVRIATGQTLSQRPSWAVSKTDWTSVRADIDVNQGRATLSTTVAQWQIDLQTGSWNLRNARGHAFFAAPTGGFGFCGTEAQASLRLADDE